jgi:hypothetical protein
MHLGECEHRIVVGFIFTLYNIILVLSRMVGYVEQKPLGQLQK